MECSIEKISCLKKFFLKSFIVSITFLLLSFIIIMPFYDFWANYAHLMFNLKLRHYSLVFTLLFGFWKILIIQFTLIPFIVLFMAEKCLKKKAAQE